MGFLRSKWSKVAVGLVLLIGVVAAYSFFSSSRTSQDSAALVPIEAQVIGDTTMDIGGTELTVVIKSNEEGNYYEFYSSGQKPKLLAQVMSFVEFEPTGDRQSPYLFEKDITGDDIPEIFVLTEQNAKSLKEYEVLRVDGETISNITVRGQKDNPKWVEFVEPEYKDGHITSLWAGAVNEFGKIFYKLDGNELVFEKAVRLSAADYGASGICDVAVMNAGDKEFTLVDTIQCDGEVYYDKYYYFSEAQLSFLKGMVALSEDAKWKALVDAYKTECEVGGQSAPFSKTFEEQIQRAENAEIDPNTQVLSVPCIQGAYQTAYMPVLYDGTAYKPLTLTKINEDGTRYEENTGVEFGYNPTTKTFSYLGAGNGVHSCWNQGEYKLVVKELVLQKFTADWDCADADGEQDEGTVIYQI